MCEIGKRRWWHRLRERHVYTWPESWEIVTFELPEDAVKPEGISPNGPDARGISCYLVRAGKYTHVHDEIVRPGERILLRPGDAVHFFSKATTVPPHGRGG